MTVYRDPRTERLRAASRTAAEAADDDQGGQRRSLGPDKRIAAAPEDEAASAPTGFSGAPIVLGGGVVPNLGRPDDQLLSSGGMLPNPPTDAPPVAPEPSASSPKSPVAPPKLRDPEIFAVLPNEPDPRPVVSLDPNVRHAAARLAFGATPALVAEIEAIGVDAFIAQQLTEGGGEDASLGRALAGFVNLGRTAAELLEDPGVDPGDVADDVRHATLLRAMWSRHQLKEVMVDFWHNHFNVLADTGSLSAVYQIDYDRDVIRPGALGSFADLLLATAHSPAMLHYLDNESNRGDNPNENYGRELLELHTLGVDGGYDESDLRNAALVLSGWTVENHAFAFRESWHWDGPAQVLDWSTDGSGGYADAVSLISYLARHPSTAQRVAAKLCRRFVSDTPPPELVASAAAVYQAGDTAIVPVLEHIFESDAFWSSRGGKLRRPFEQVVASLRLTNSSVELSGQSDAARRLRERLQDLAQLPFAWPAPNGYPDEAPPWLSADAMLQRWRFVADLTHGNLDGVQVDVAALLPDPIPATAGELVSAAAARILTEPLDTATWSELLAYVGTASTDVTSIELLTSRGPGLLALLLASPGLQLR